jgi:NAD(P)-dependent dehydrogenase (short-subunit alcohol dehydrogenase family)
MSNPNSNKIALVTGGAIRIGRAISIALAEAGYDLVVAHHSSVDQAVEVQKIISSLGRRCELVQADLREPNTPDIVVESVRQVFGRLDLLVNSAASFESSSLLELGVDEWDSVMALNCRAPHLLVRAAADLLRESHGSVVNIVDLSAFQPWSEFPAHAVSKAGLAHLTRIQARVLAPEVRVNAIAPGALLRPNDWSDKRWAAIAEATPLKCSGSPDDVSQAVLFFADADFVTGEILTVDGGRHLGPDGPPISV